MSHGLAKMERIDKETALNIGSDENNRDLCMEESRWPRDLDFDYESDDELVAFYEHAEICPVHREMVKVANTDFALSLIQFNCRLRASAEPKYNDATLKRMLSQKSVGVHGGESESE